MVNKIFMTILSVSYLSIATAEAEAGNPEKLHMTVGESRSLRVEDAIRLHVTRKGIIHLVHDHDDYWSVTAVKSGVVAIEVKLRQEDPRVIYIDVKPRLPSSKSNLKTAPKLSTPVCTEGSSPHQYEIHATVELVDGSDLETSGTESQVSLSWNAKTIGGNFALETSPQKSVYKRRIIGDPVITGQACDTLEIRAGGEDEFEVKNDQGHVVSAWKSHGLTIQMKLIPIDKNFIKVPFEVSLKSPSRDRGNYGMSEVSSAINLQLTKKTLAAAINMSSSSASEKEPLFIAKIPIIGPLFRSTSDSQSSSKLLIWLTVSPI